MDIIVKGYPVPVRFMWDMKPDECLDLFGPFPDAYKDLRDYCGAVFVGDLKIEFIRTEDMPYVNVFQYGAERSPDNAYGYLEDGTPYEECDELEDAISLRPAGSFDAFAAGIESQIADLLNRYPDYIPAVMETTNPDKWYPGSAPYHIDEITREA